eukprot:scaffold1270_cov176-Alexandrium_tamarense.AAC.9
MGNEQSDNGELIVSIVATELSSDDCFFFDGVVVHISVDWSLLFDFFPPPFFLLVTIKPKYLYLGLFRNIGLAAACAIALELGVGKTTLFGALLVIRRERRSSVAGILVDLWKERVLDFLGVLNVLLLAFDDDDEIADVTVEIADPIVLDWCVARLACSRLFMLIRGATIERISSRWRLVVLLEVKELLIVWTSRNITPHRLRLDTLSALCFLTSSTINDECNATDT